MVRSSNGAISVDRAGAGVDAKTSNGSIRIGEVARGSIVVGTPAGDLEIGIVEGTAARLAVTINRSRPAIAATGLRRLAGAIERAGGEDTGSEGAFR